MTLRSNFKISVITVSFNSAKTLGRTLQSVAEQDFPTIEHIVIDGASTDQSMEIVSRNRSHIAHAVSEPDNGIYDAMNKGLLLASGDVICFLNADDYYAHDRVLSNVAAQMLENGLDALMGDVAYFHAKFPLRIVRRYRSDRFHPNLLAWGWMPAHPALFLSNEVVQRVGLFKTNYQIAGDYDFILRVFYKQSMHYQHLPEVLVHMQTGGVSTNGLRSKILLNREVLRACRENGVKTNILKILTKYPLKILELFNK